MRRSPSPLAAVLAILLSTTTTTAYPVSSIARNEPKNFKRDQIKICDQEVQIRSQDECQARVVRSEQNGERAMYDWPDAETLQSIGTSPFTHDTIQFTPANNGRVKPTGISEPRPRGHQLRNFQCDHVLAPDLVAAVVARGGLCNNLDDAKKEAIRHITDLLSSDENLILLHETVYAFKKRVTEAFIAKHGVTQFTETAPFAYLAFRHYIEETISKSLDIAEKIDNVLDGTFDRRGWTVAASQTIYFNVVRRGAKKAFRLISKLKDGQGNPPLGMGSVTGPGHGVPPFSPQSGPSHGGNLIFNGVIPAVPNHRPGYCVPFHPSDGPAGYLFTDDPRMPQVPGCLPVFVPNPAPHPYVQSFHLPPPHHPQPQPHVPSFPPGWGLQPPPDGHGSQLPHGAYHSQPHVQISQQEWGSQLPSGTQPPHPYPPPPHAPPGGPGGWV